MPVGKVSSSAAPRADRLARSFCGARLRRGSIRVDIRQLLAEFRPASSDDDLAL